MIKTFLAATAVAAFALPAHAVTVVQWNFETAVAPATSTTWTGIAASTGTGTASASHALNATWSTPAGNGSSQSISASNWVGGDYWQFSFSTLGYTGMALTFDQTSSSTGPSSFNVYYSVNGGAFVSNTPFQYSVSQSTWSSGSATPASTISLNLSSATPVNNQSSVTLRLVQQAGNQYVGTNSVDNFTVSMTPVPESGTGAMLVAGLAAMGFIVRRPR